MSLLQKLKAWILANKVEKIPREFVEGIIDVFEKPPTQIAEWWDDLSEEDRELYKKAFWGAVKLGAKQLAKYADD